MTSGYLLTESATKRMLLIVTTVFGWIILIVKIVNLKTSMIVFCVLYVFWRTLVFRWKAWTLTVSLWREETVAIRGNGQSLPILPAFLAFSWIFLCAVLFCFSFAAFVIFWWPLEITRLCFTILLLLLRQIRINWPYLLVIVFFFRHLIHIWNGLPVLMFFLPMKDVLLAQIALKPVACQHHTKPKTYGNFSW